MHRRRDVVDRRRTRAVGGKGSYPAPWQYDFICLLSQRLCHDFPDDVRYGSCSAVAVAKSSAIYGLDGVRLCAVVEGKVGQWVAEDPTLRRNGVLLSSFSFP